MMREYKREYSLHTYYRHTIPLYSVRSLDILRYTIIKYYAWDILKGVYGGYGGGLIWCITPSKFLQKISPIVVLKFIYKYVS